ncbi:MAG TPA: 3-hydroxyacyl-CoA dehydrogenase NAD-binding domain-containing protein [Sphingomonadales bacterium]|nr:3-hydroxyacyl-CoA dehydrogenase NAD-binding domain-containing protein [Sphingomonadales bacterium]
MPKTFTYSVGADGIALIEIAVPDHSMNVLTRAFLSELETAVDGIAEDAKVKGAIITSARDAFVAGADLAMISEIIAFARKGPPAKAFEQVFALNRLFRKIETCGKPFAAAVNGLTLGGGFELALCCHYRVAVDDDAIKIGFPEVQLGLLPGAGGTQRLPRLAGVMAALQYLSTGKNMNPKEAKALGIFHDVVPRAGLLNAARKWLLETPDPVAPWDKAGFKIPGGGGAMHPKAVQVFVAANAMAQEKTLHNYPAVEAILSCVYEGSIVPFDLAIRIEAKYFTKIIRRQEAGNMVRTLFVNKQAADKLAARPKAEPGRKTRVLGVLGAGMMGAGIAYVSARAGMNVVLLDRDLPSAEKGKAHSERLVAEGVAKGKLKPGDGAAILGRIRPTASFADLKDCDLVIEAVFENPDIKAGVIRKTEAVIAPESFFASNTSTLPITGLARNSQRPEKFIGIHFFSPVEKMMLVEIIVGRETSEAALAKALDTVRQLRKTPIVVNDSRGFYTSRCFATYVEEGISMLAEGVKPALIENAGRMAGMPVGPLAVGDEVSIELMVEIQKQIRAGHGRKHDPQPPEKVASLMVEKLGRKGRKNGKGFYEYPSDAKKYLWPGLADHFPPARRQPDVEILKKRFLYRQAVEAARCLDEGVLRDPASGDVGAVFGWGFAPFTGGPFSMIDSIGPKVFVKEAEALAKAFGARFLPSKGLKERAKTGKSYYPKA